MRKIRWSSLLAILALTFTLAETALAIGPGPWDHGYDWQNCHPPTREEIEQSLWNFEAYRFLYYDDYGYYPYDVMARAQPQYSAPSTSPSANNDSAVRYLEEANVSYLTGSYEAAAESYAKDVNLDPTLAAGWLNLGNSLYLLGRYQASLNAYNTLLGLEPNNSNALAGKNQALMALNDANNRSASGGP
jgi:tetratricopeptide (TPR) repeat protein